MSSTKTTNPKPRPKSHDLMTFLAESSGYCCLYAFLRDNSHKRASAWAEELGISARTIRNYRAVLREGVTRCRRLEKHRCAKDWVGTSGE